MADKKPPEYEQEMQRRQDAKAKEAYDKASPIGKSIPEKKTFKKGGFVRSADGVARKGKTKGRMV